MIMKRIVAFGNPLLDTIVLGNNDILLKKYNLEIDGQKEISSEEMTLLKNDIETREKTITAGGCAQNTLKIMKWLLGDHCTSTMIGAVGSDKEGDLLEEILEKSGIKTDYVQHSHHNTGLTISLVSGENRSLVACLGAAEILSLQDIKQKISVVDDADLVYMEGFFLTKRNDEASFILDYCDKKDKLFAFNLSGEYLCREYPDLVQQFLKQCSIIFGNKREFKALAEYRKSDALDLVTELNNQGKVVVMTDGANSVICKADGMCCEVEVPKLKRDEIVDTTGAGDSFVAGFLSGFILKKKIEECIKWGCYAAEEIIKRQGCLVPEYHPKL